MQREVLSEPVTVVLTTQEKQQLIELARAHGATMRGTIRRLIRDAAQGGQNAGAGSPAQEGGPANG